MLIQKPILGISSCLLGEKVRYDGRIRHYQNLIEQLQETFEFISFCPEVASGLPVPREPMDLFVLNGEIKMLTVNSQKDITPAILRAGNEVIDSYMEREVCGFVFKAKSPSCGLRLAKVHTDKMVIRNGIGLFAQAFKEVFPELPVATELDLENLKFRKQFISSVLTVSYEKLKFN